jgi:hypothetical protein
VQPNFPMVGVSPDLESTPLEQLSPSLVQRRRPKPLPRIKGLQSAAKNQEPPVRAQNWGFASDARPIALVSCTKTRTLRLSSDNIKDTQPGDGLQ